MELLPPETSLVCVYRNKARKSKEERGDDSVEVLTVVGDVT